MTQSPYHGLPGFKAVGTSAAAAFAVAGDADTLREKCLSMLQLRGDMTADECAALLDRSVLSVRPRFTELFVAGRIFKSGMRRENNSGHSANVYTLETQGKLL